MEFFDTEMDDSAAENLSEGSDLGELVEQVQTELNKLISSSKHTKNGSVIVKSAVFANVLHVFANLAEVGTSDQLGTFRIIITLYCILHNVTTLRACGWSYV